MWEEDAIRTALMRLATGREDALTDLMDLRWNNLVEYCFSLIQDAMMAEEVASDVLLRLWQNRERYDPSKNPIAYVKTICRNAATDARRRDRERHGVVPLDTVSELILLARFVGRDADEIASRITISELLRLAFRSLDPGYCELLHLHYIEGMSYSEIASLLKIPVGTVKSRMNYATKKLRGAIREIPGWE